MAARLLGWLVLPNGFVCPLTDRPYSWRERLVLPSDGLGSPAVPPAPCEGGRAAPAPDEVWV